MKSKTRVNVADSDNKRWTTFDFESASAQIIESLVLAEVLIAEVGRHLAHVTFGASGSGMENW